jgi:hypothetical protein
VLNVVEYILSTKLVALAAARSQIHTIFSNSVSLSEIHDPKVAELSRI